MKICLVCGGRLNPFGPGIVLGHRKVLYHRCAACGCIFLTDPDWLGEAYSQAISAQDVGLLERCLQLSNITSAVIVGERLRHGSFLDFAGGYGTLTRLMRDRGFNFGHHDPMCPNLFARGFENDPAARHDLVTAFEVLEHLTDPVATLRPLAARTDFLLVTTQVVPHPAPAPGHWDYYAEDTGQHVTFFTTAGLNALAKALGMKVLTTGRTVHLFHRDRLRLATRLLLRDERLAYALGAVQAEIGRRHGLLLPDALKAAKNIRAHHP